MDIEKKAVPQHVEDITDGQHPQNAVLVDTTLGQENHDTEAALSKENHTILIPRPSDDPCDSLNWSWWKKHAVLVTIALAGFLAEFAIASGPSCVVLQGAEWNMTPDHVNYANNLSVLFVGIGGVLAIPFLYFWGRAPTVFWCVLLGGACTLACALAPNFEFFYGFRALQGFTLTGGQTSGLAILHDIFFFHEEARKIGLWTVCFIVSPYFGPMFATYIVGLTGSWRGVYWMSFGLAALNIVLLLVIFDETFYRRDIPMADQPPRGNRFNRIVGIWQIRHHHGYFETLGQSVYRIWAIMWKPVMVLVLVYYVANFMWAVGINQTAAILIASPREAGGYGFSATTLGHMYFAPVIGVAIGELFGHFFNDFVAARYIRTHKGVFIPEARLPPIFISATFMAPGLVLIGQTLQQHLHWAGIVVGWGMFVFGCMVASVAITAYAVDSYPENAGEVSSLINLARMLGGFSVGYFQLAWGMKAGFDVSFGVQAAVVVGGLLVIPVLLIFGPVLRSRGER